MNEVSDNSKKHALSRIVKGFNLETILFQNKLFYKELDVRRILNEVECFCELHYLKEEMDSICKNTSIGRVDIPAHYRVVMRYKYPDRPPCKVAFEKMKVDEYVKNKENHVSKKERKISEKKKKIEDGYTIGEALEILNVSRVTFNEVRKNNLVNERKINGKQFSFDKEDILKLKRKTEDFYKEYITLKKATDTFFNGDENILYKHSDCFEKYDAPIYAYTKDNTTSIAQYKGKVLKISEIEYLRDNIKNIRREKLEKKEEQGRTTRMKKSFINYDIEGETYLDTFYLRLYEKWDGFKENSSYTRDKWFEFITNKINSMRADRKVSLNKINSYITCTRELDDMLTFFEVNEVYELTTNNVNTYFNLLDTRQKREIIYEFLSIVSEDVVCILKKRHSKKKGFNMEKIHSPYGEESKKRKLKPYGFDVYSALFKYATSTSFHVKKSIEQISKNKRATYVSTWLYTMLHLNNAWRHGDVSRFPLLEIEDILVMGKIDDYSWFVENEVTLELSRTIITRIRQWELRISKTGAKGVFFCSDELAPSLVTGILILTLYNRKNGQIYQKDSEENASLMEFKTKYNQPSEKHLNDYFDGFAFGDFKFSSLRMNKTIMTYIYYIANLSGDSKALVYAQKIRAHLDEESPLSYIEIDCEVLESLTRQLFKRGEFGYITSLLMARLNKSEGNTVSFEEMTDQIIQVNGLFGELAGVYNTVGFLNNIRHERQVIIDTLAEKSLEQCQKILTNIFAKKLPSRMENVQCLISKEGCCQTDKDKSCFDCPYHIPSIYALTTLCENIMNDLKLYKSSSRVKQLKLSLSIDRKVVLLKEAIKKYGEEYVYNCIGIDREEFIEMLDAVACPDEFDDIVLVEG